MGHEVHVLRFREGELRLDRTAIMGIVNVTPDSFSDGGRFLDPPAAIEHALRLAEEGAEILDIGGESTRPGSDPVSADEEWRRVAPVLKGLRPKTDARISIDTYKPAVAAKALALGVDIVNDIHGLRDPNMIRAVGLSGAAAIVMHMKGEPKAMQRAPSYGEVVSDVARFLEERTRAAIEGGIARESLVVDPGLGFGKTPEHNTELLQGLSEFHGLGFPILVGTSGKWFAGELGGSGARGSAQRGVAPVVLAAKNGADLVRVHEVAATAKAIRSVTAVGRDGR